ncbi:hypothetical protein [Desertibacillus haloalkaliphilus]|uniref:hypothetical protein n=1 Tax=Desertibacillus haloalkaliphilus TaxID=1328930 RepID=UPI001C261296|nr:hypothetical protein [Desertibacillus haloalkaliphilus]MBU8906829.1 hypothetical protein [Desertibacillus haloalkaliphilus]
MADKTVGYDNKAGKTTNMGIDVYDMDHTVTDALNDQTLEQRLQRVPVNQYIHVRAPLDPLHLFGQ